MSLDQLLATLEQEARVEAERIMAEAGAEAARVAGKAEAERVARRDTTLGELEHDLEATLQAELSVARLEARRQVLRARERLLARLFAAVEERLATLASDPVFLAGLPASLDAAVACLGPDTPLRCVASPELIAAIHDAARLPDAVPVTEDPTLTAGFRLVAIDGSVEVVDTATVRMAARRTDLSRRALTLLGFG